METFYRQSFSELVITLRANSSLGLMDSGYIEDYFGTDNQFTLHNMGTDEREAILVAEDTEATPGTPHDVFEAVIDLSTAANGIYRVEGRVRDTAGNYTILSDFQTPLGSEDLIMLEILISPLGVVVLSPKEGTLSLSVVSECQLSLVSTVEAVISLYILETEVALSLKPEIEAALSLTVTPEFSLSLSDEIDFQLTRVYTV